MLYCSSHVEICLVTQIPSYCACSASLAKNAPISILQLKNFNLSFKIEIRLHLFCEVSLDLSLDFLHIS